MAFNTRLGTVYTILDVDGNDRRGELRFNEDGSTVSFHAIDVDGVEQTQSFAVDLDTGAVSLTPAPGDFAITGGLTVSGRITSGEGDVSYRTVANDVVPTIGRADAGGVIELLNTTTGNKAILTDTSGDGAVELGQEVTIFLTAATGNSYTLALSTGTLTFNAALECAKIVRTSLGWNVVSLNGATIV